MEHEWRKGGSFPSAYFYEGLHEKYVYYSQFTVYDINGVSDSIYERAVKLRRRTYSPYWDITWIYS